MKKLVAEIKERLEFELDNGFPKIEKEGPKKRANKRGEALGLFAVAMLEIQRLIIAFGGCTRCYGKGYGTQTLNYEHGADFLGDKQYTTKAPTMVFCSCPRGKALMKLWHEGEESLLRAKKSRGRR